MNVNNKDMKRCGQMSKEQKRYLVQYIEDHPELQSGKFSQQFTFKSAQSLWKNLSNILNSMPGSRKDWKKWRKTWHDMKNLAKSKGASLKKYRNTTGGGPPPKDELNSEEEKILGMISSVAIGGHQSIDESKALFIPDNVINNEVIDITCDHNYFDNYSLNESNTNSVNIIENMLNTDINIENNNTDINNENNKNEINSNIENGKIMEDSKKNKTKSKKVTRIQRLENSISATKKMANQMERKITIRKNYCTKKLKILRQNVDAKKRMAAALETIARSFEQNMHNE